MGNNVICESKSSPNVVVADPSSIATNVTIEDNKGPDVKGKNSSTVSTMERTKRTPTDETNPTLDVIIQMSGDNSNNFTRDSTAGSKNSDETNPLLAVVVDVPGDNSTNKDSTNASGMDNSKSTKDLKIKTLRMIFVISFSNFTFTS